MRPGHKARTWRLVAYIRELASLGVRGKPMAAMLGVDHAYIRSLASQHKIALSQGDSALSRAVRDGYARRMQPKDIADANGTSLKSVHVTAWKLGITSKLPRDSARYKRGYVVPAELWGDYRAYKRKGYSFEEIGRILGLTPKENRQ